MVATLVLSTPILNILLWTGLQPEDTRLGWAVYAGRALALCIFSRLFLVFPATAVDRRVNLKWAWRLSKNNGWRLAIVVAVLPWVLSSLVWLLYREDATVFEDVFIAFLGSAIIVFEVAALSLSYRELAKEESGGFRPGH
jgi:hypothetical protein